MYELPFSTEQLKIIRAKELLFEALAVIWKQDDNLKHLDLTKRIQQFLKESLNG